MKEQTNDTESFLGRWARLKKDSHQPPEDATQPAALPEPVTPPDMITAEETPSLPQAPIDTISEPRLLTDEDMPPIETLDANSDYQGFMSSGVSEELRRLALRKLFAAPQFNVRDGLDSYDDDYTTFAKLDPGVITSDMQHMLEVEARRALDKLSQHTPPATDSQASTEALEDAEPTSTLKESDTESGLAPAIEAATDSPATPDSNNTEEHPA